MSRLASAHAGLRSHVSRAVAEAGKRTTTGGAALARTGSAPEPPGLHDRRDAPTGAGFAALGRGGFTEPRLRDPRRSDRHVRDPSVYRGSLQVQTETLGSGSLR